MQSLAPSILANAEYVVKAESFMDGTVVWFRFANNYGVSVVRFSGSYGGSSGLFEAGLIKFRDESTDWDFVTDSNVDGFDDSGVQGWLTIADIDRILIVVMNLTANFEIGR